MNELLSNMVKVVSDSVNSMNDDDYHKLKDDCVSTLRKGNKIIVSGLGKNTFVCEKFVGTMLSYGLNAAFLHTNTAVHGDLGMIKDGDLVIVLSKSGRTEESILLIEHLKKRSISDWSITFDGSSPVSTLVSHSLSLELGSEGDLWNKSPNNSVTVYLMILQALAIDLAKILGVTFDDFIKNHPGGHIGASN